MVSGATFAVGRWEPDKPGGPAEFVVQCELCWEKPVLAPYTVNADRVANFIAEHECKR